MPIRWKAGLSAGVCLMAACTVLSAPAAAREPRFAVEQLKENTRVLASDEFEGRAPATAGETKTVAYIAAEMAKAGLKPGNGDSWYQEVPLVEITSDPNMQLTIAPAAGGGAPLTLDFSTDFIATSPQARERVSLDGSEMVFVGYGVVAPERNWNDYAGLDVRGKTVVILVNDPDWESTSREGSFEGRAMTYYGRWTYKYEEAARQGAAGAIIVHQTEPAAYGWNVVQSSWSGPQLYTDDGRGGTDKVPVIGWVTQDRARQIFALAGQDLAALAAAARQPGFKPVPLGLKANLSLTNTVRRSVSYNVVGLLPGKTRPNEHVLYMAHWDHLGRCKPDETGDDICNGALDNASGVAGLIALGAAHVKAGPADRSLVFLAVTAEESGLLGSAYYAQNPIYPLATTAGGVNMDMLNVIGRTRDFVVVGAGKSELEPLAEKAVARQDRVIAPDPKPEAGHYFRSDHFSLARQGVPMLYAESGVDVRGKGPEWGKARMDEYTAQSYHGPGDEYDPNWDWSGALEDLAVYYEVGRELADGDAWPNWYEGSEFKAARDRARATVTGQR
jgi:Zn-dependent M28 family amino/carboxypeptidase